MTLPTGKGRLAFHAQRETFHSKRGFFLILKTFENILKTADFDIIFCLLSSGFNNLCMTRKLLVLCILALNVACSADSPNEEIPLPAQNFEVSLTPSVSEVYVDIPFTVKVQANEGIFEISRVMENRVESITSLSPGVPLDTGSLTLHLGFGFTGTENVVLEFTSITGKKSTKTLKFEVKRGNAVKITGFKINSFHNMNGSWDPEYADNDINRLADIQFGFRKLRQGHITHLYPAMSSWYVSPVYPNEQQLEFDLSQYGLFISENYTLRFGMADADDDGTAQDLTMWHEELKINFQDYKQTKPSEINLSNEEYGFDVSVQLEWL